MASASRARDVDPIDVARRRPCHSAACSGATLRAPLGLRRPAAFDPLRFFPRAFPASAEGLNMRKRCWRPSSCTKSAASSGLSQHPSRWPISGQRFRWLVTWKWEHADLTRDGEAGSEPLLVRIDPDRDLPDLPLKASLFVSFTLGGTVGLEAAHGPALGNHPSAGSRAR